MKKNKDYKDFLSSKPIEVPPSLSQSIFKVVQGDLNPSASIIFSKVSLIHF